MFQRRRSGLTSVTLQASGDELVVVGGSYAGSIGIAGGVGGITRGEVRTQTRRFPDFRHVNVTLCTVRFVPLFEQRLPAIDFVLTLPASVLTAASECNAIVEFAALEERSADGAPSKPPNPVAAAVTPTQTTHTAIRLPSVPPL